MAGIEFSVPYNPNGGANALEKVFGLQNLNGNRIREVYLSGPQEYSGSGRVTGKLSLKQFLEVVDRIHEEGIEVNLVLNSTCEGSNGYSTAAMDKLVAFLRRVHDKNGVEAVTIANPCYIREVKRKIPDIKICASVLADIDCVQRAVVFREAGADIITPDININRDLKLLKEMKEATGAELKLMVNEGCLYKCPFRKFHFNYISHKSKEMDEAKGDTFSFPMNCCIPVTLKDKTQVLKSRWIRPEDTGEYSSITNFFKIVGRSVPVSRTMRAIKAYLEEDWNGDLLDIMCSSLYTFSLRYGTYLDNKKLGDGNFFKKVTSCSNNCNQCHYYEEVAKDLMLGWLTVEKLRDLGLDEKANELEMKEKALYDNSVSHKK